MSSILCGIGGLDGGGRPRRHRWPRLSTRPRLAADERRWLLPASGNPAAAPAPASMLTTAPALASPGRDSGTSATRCSRSARSFKTTILMAAIMCRASKVPGFLGSGSGVSRFRCVEVRRTRGPLALQRTLLSEHLRHLSTFGTSGAQAPCHDSSKSRDSRESHVTATHAMTV